MQETADSCGISSMPTFQFYKQNAKICEFSGADATKLKSLITSLNATTI